MMGAEDERVVRERGYMEGEGYVYYTVETGSLGTGDG